MDENLKKKTRQNLKFRLSSVILKGRLLADLSWCNSTFKQCCGSGMFIPDPDFYPSRIPDPKTATKGVKKFFCQTILCSHKKFHKTEYYFIFEMLKKKIWPNFPRIIEVFTQKFVTKPSKIWVWDPGSEIRDPEKTYSGSRSQKGTGSRIRIRNTAFKSA